MTSISVGNNSLPAKKITYILKVSHVRWKKVFCSIAALMVHNGGQIADKASAAALLSMTVMIYATVRKHSV